MKKKTAYLILLAAIVLLVLIGGKELPKYAGRLIGFGALLFTDSLYWLAFTRYVRGRGKAAATILKVSYWIPPATLLLFLSATACQPMQHWPPFFRVYFPGILIPLYSWKFLLLAFMLVGELVVLPLNLWKLFASLGTKSRITWVRIRLFISAGLIAGTLLALVLFSGFFFWVYDFRVITVEIGVKELPESFEGLRIVQLSDLHLGSWISAKPLKRALDLVNDQHPDLVVFTGDLVNYTTPEAYPFEEQLRQIHAPLGVFSILGNHDYGDYVNWNKPEAKAENDRFLRTFYSKIGWSLLRNENAILHKGADSIALLGVENWSLNKIWGRRGNMAEAETGTGSMKVKILLSHDPTHWRAEILKKYPDISLTLSGHTHAMQMGWETSRFRWSPSEWVFPEWAGLYSSQDAVGNDQYLYVNRGLGHLGFPGRVGIRPEITLFILHRK